MRRLTICLQILILVASVALVTSQVLGYPQEEQEDVRLPSGKSQKEEILRNEHGENLKDATRLVDLAQGLKAELEKKDHRVLSLNAIKSTEEIERLAKRIRSRIRK